MSPTFAEQDVHSPVASPPSSIVALARAFLQAALAVALGSGKLAVDKIRQGETLHFDFFLVSTVVLVGFTALQ